MRKLLIFILLLFQIILAESKNYYISNLGSNKNSGSKTNPFLTLEKARDEARKIKENVNIVLLDDYYNLKTSFQLSEEDENVSIISSSDKSTKISGGINISIDKIESLKNYPLYKHFPTKIRDHIAVVNLTELGINDFGKIRPVGFSRPYGSAPLELFINGEPCRLARWPNDSTVAIGNIIDKGSVPRTGDFTNRGGKFEYNCTRPNTWTISKNIWISGYFMHGYAEDAVKVDEIDTKNKTFKTVHPHLYGFGSGKPWNQWYAFNIPEEIDESGEYFLDRESGILYFYYSKEINELSVSLLSQPMFQIIGSQNIKIENLIFENSRGMAIYLENSDNCIVKDCTFRNLGSLAINIGKGIKPFANQKHEGEGEPASGLIGSLAQHLYSNTMFDRMGGSNNGIINCHIYNTGAGGINLGGGNRKSLIPAENYVENCKIHDCNRIEKSYRPAIHINGVGNRISNCEIFNTPSMAILLHGNDHIIENSEFFKVCNDVDDQGAIYYGRDPSERGNIVRNNYFHHLGNAHRTTAVYHDDGACGMEVYSNIFVQAGTIPVLIGGGSDNIYKNNVFIDCPLGIHVDNRFQNWSKNSLVENGIIDNRLDATNYEQPPYSIKYPQLKNYWINSPEIPGNNQIQNNIFCGVEQVIRGNEIWYNMTNNIIRDEIPELWIKKIDELYFNPDLKLLNKPINWNNIDQSKIGIIK